MTSAGEDKWSVSDTGTQCISCAGRSFRRSRLKAADVWSLLGLRYPVRCLACSKRQTVPLAAARRAMSSKLRQVRAGQHAEEVHEDSRQQQPSVVGGSGTWAMPVHEPITMPDLRGVTLKHRSSLPIGDESSSR